MTRETKFIIGAMYDISVWRGYLVSGVQEELSRILDILNFEKMIN